MTQLSVLAAFTAVLLVACGKTDNETARAIDPGADTESVARESASSPRDEALEAYEESNDYMERALRYPDPQDPELADHFAGRALDENGNLLLGAVQSNEYYESSLDSDPIVVTSGPGEVVLSDCVTETATVFDAVTGTEKSSDSTMSNWRVRVVDTDAGWRVEEIAPQEEPCPS